MNPVVKNLQPVAPKFLFLNLLERANTLVILGNLLSLWQVY